METYAINVPVTDEEFNNPDNQYLVGDQEYTVGKLLDSKELVGQVMSAAVYTNAISITCIRCSSAYALTLEFNTFSISIYFGPHEQAGTTSVSTEATRFNDSSKDRCSKIQYRLNDVIYTIIHSISHRQEQ